MNSAAPLVSVIIPAYNAAAYIAVSLKSALEQTYANLEVLVVDDGSSDETPEIVEAFVRLDPRVRLIRQQNAGVGAARNGAIVHAKGRYLAPLDADDLWHPEKISEQVAIAEREGEQIGFVYCWSSKMNDAGKLVARFPPCEAIGDVFRRLVFRNFLHNASVPLFRASAVALVGGYATRHNQGGAQGCEDWELTLRVAEKFRVAVVPRYLVNYREISSGMSFGGEGMARSFAYLQAGLRGRNPALPESLYLWSAGFFYLYLAGKCRQANNARGALAFLRRAVRSDLAVITAPTFHRVLLASAFLSRRPASAGISSSSAGKPSRARAATPPALWALFGYIENQRWAQLEAEAPRP